MINYYIILKFYLGNCEIAELLIQSAEKMGIRLDQYLNREGNGLIFINNFNFFQSFRLLSSRTCT
jgi:hypothetical protein